MATILELLRNNLLELFGALTGFVSVVLAVKNTHWNWPISIISYAIYIVVCWKARMYSNSGLQVFYIVMCIYGWWSWLQKPAASESLSISFTPRKIFGTLAIFTVLSTISLFYFLRRFTNNVSPALDALTTCISLSAQYLTAKKKIENWIAWTIVNGIYVFLFIKTRLYVTSALYGTFIILGVIGYMHWKKLLKKEESGTGST